VRKVVITAGGLGTRLLPMSKELPKEMMPIFLKGINDDIILKPLLQALFEQFYSVGFREFCFVVGRGKRAIEDHFTPDWKYVELLEENGKIAFANELKSFYGMIEKSRIMWVNQPEPRGFGHAVLMAESFVGNDPFFVAAGDTYIASNDFIVNMIDLFSNKHLSAVLLLQRVLDPSQYGVAVVDGGRVLKVVEKPKEFVSDLAIMPFYIFDPVVMKIIPQLKPGVSNEIQLTDAIQRLIEIGRVEAVFLSDNILRFDIGTPRTYWEAIKGSYKLAGGKVD
ncbi:sugar phosphate nucleotidyltransferase, partial [Candidatus Culexarchaeum yellowstonense]|uniref:sugar phosphate nucleotidyltransferase n=1 Tax=Candidatus Culexarchaeum yellowstonense TaxID=2928963 RepID=UPI0026ED019F